MRKLLVWFCGLLLFWETNAPSTTPDESSARPPSPVPRRPHLADYDSELRRTDGRVDTDAMVVRLKELGVTTYYWLVWHAPTDWEDLKLFLPRCDVRGHVLPGQTPRQANLSACPTTLSQRQVAVSVNTLTAQQ
jgi:hypothetical protein